MARVVSRLGRSDYPAGRNRGAPCRHTRTRREENRTVNKRTVGILSGFIAASSLVYLGSQLKAQNYPPQTQAGAGMQPAHPVTSRIAVVNLGQVIKNYQKFKVLSK